MALGQPLDTGSWRGMSEAASGADFSSRRC
jgi:hypothetical protein